jgi:hypothetical protein
MVMKGSFSLDGTTPASHIGPLYLALLALLYRVVGHRPAWVPMSQHGIGCDYGILSVSRGETLLRGTIGEIAVAATFLSLCPSDAGRWLGSLIRSYAKPA